MKTDLFQSCGHSWVFQICWHIECSTFTAPSVRIWNSSTGIPSPPLALFIVMLSKAHLTSHSITNSQRLLKLMSIELVMPSNHLILYKPRLLLTSIIPSIRGFSNESVLHNILGFPGGSDGKSSASNAGDPGSIPGLGRSPGRRKWQSIPGPLPRKFHGWRSLVGYSSWGHKELDYILDSYQIYNLHIFLPFCSCLFYFLMVSSKAQRF